jgi:hypothetical protein
VSSPSYHPSQVIIEAEDEYRRRGHWTRLFPCAGMRSYLTFFQFQRYGITHAIYPQPRHIPPSTPPSRYSNTLLAKWFEKPEWPLLAPHLNRGAWVAGYTPSIGTISGSGSARSKTAAINRDASRDGIYISGGGRFQPQDGGEMVARLGTYSGTARPAGSGGRPRSASRRETERETERARGRARGSPQPLRVAAAAEREGRQPHGGGGYGGGTAREGPPLLNAIGYYAQPSLSPGGHTPGHTPVGQRRHSAATNPNATRGGYDGGTRGPSHGVGVVRRWPFNTTTDPTPNLSPSPNPDPNPNPDPDPHPNQVPYDPVTAGREHATLMAAATAGSAVPPPPEVSSPPYRAALTVHNERVLLLSTAARNELLATARATNHDLAGNHEGGAVGPGGGSSSPYGPPLGQQAAIGGVVSSSPYGPPVPPAARVPGEQRTYYGVPGSSPVSGGMALLAALSGSAHGGGGGGVGSSPQLPGGGPMPPPPLGMQGVQGRRAQSTAAVQSIQSAVVPTAAASMAAARQGAADRSAAARKEAHAALGGGVFSSASTLGQQAAIGGVVSSSPKAGVVSSSPHRPPVALPRPPQSPVKPLRAAHDLRGGGGSAAAEAVALFV